MTWTWHDDDPATALSAQNMQTHIELRLRALEVAGGGGGESAALTSDQLKFFGVDAGFEMHEGAAGTVFAYKLGGVIHIGGGVYIDHAVAASALSGNEALLTLPADWTPNPLISGNVTGMVGAYAGSTKTVEPWNTSSGNEIWLYGLLDSGTSWTVSFDAVSFPHS